MPKCAKKALPLKIFFPRTKSGAENTVLDSKRGPLFHL
jgi:hypothetical protein